MTMVIQGYVVQQNFASALRRQLGLLTDSMVRELTRVKRDVAK